MLTPQEITQLVGSYLEGKPLHPLPVGVRCNLPTDSNRLSTLMEVLFTGFYDLVTAEKIERIQLIDRALKSHPEQQKTCSALIRAMVAHNQLTFEPWQSALLHPLVVWHQRQEPLDPALGQCHYGTGSYAQIGKALGSTPHHLCLLSGQLSNSSKDLVLALIRPVQPLGSSGESEWIPLLGHCALSGLSTLAAFMDPAELKKAAKRLLALCMMELMSRTGVIPDLDILFARSFFIDGVTHLYVFQYGAQKIGLYDSKRVLLKWITASEPRVGSSHSLPNPFTEKHWVGCEFTKADADRIYVLLPAAHQEPVNDGDDDEDERAKGKRKAESVGSLSDRPPAESDGCTPVALHLLKWLNHGSEFPTGRFNLVEAWDTPDENSSRRGTHPVFFI